MPRRPTPIHALACLLITLCAIGATAAAQDDADDNDAPPGWPRWFERDGHRMIVYQPQVDRWHGYRLLSARAAVAVVLAGEHEPEYGAIRFTAPTTVDFPTRMVRIGRRTFAGSRFPGTDPDRYEEVRAAVELMLTGNRPVEMALDEIIAYLDLEEQPITRVRVELEPPPIIWSPEPAIALTFYGPPRFETVGATGIMASTNADWDVFLDLGPQRYYLLHGTSWLTTNDPESGTWTAAHLLPAGLALLPDEPQWQAARENVPGTPASSVPRVFVTEETPELIITDGAPRYEAIAGTPLEFAANTQSDLFRNTEDGVLYFLSAGVWSRAESLEGPWSAASGDLPRAFTDIPRDHPRARALASVPGTPEAEAAVLLASIPRTATIDRRLARLTVTYQGEPRFEPIEGAVKISSAVNTEFDVFNVRRGFFCCDDGVWFTAKDASGPWQVADVLPAEIYTIPPYAPQHNVTYVKVYDSTSETVTVGQSRGYTGEIITTAGVVVAGLIYAFSEADSVGVRVRVNAGPITVRGRHRSGAVYDERIGGFRASSAAYGPYARNVARTQPRARATGVAATDADPYRGWKSARVRAWRPRDARGRSLPDGRPALGTALAGDVFAGLDGRVFRRGEDGSWHERSEGQWKKFDGSRASDRRGRLDRQHRSRSLGTDRAARHRRARGRR